MKVVFCTDGIFPHQVGGMQRHSKLLMEELKRLSPKLELTAIHPHKDTRVFDAEQGIREIYVPGIDTGKNYLKESYAYSKRVYHELKKLPEETVIYNQGFVVWHKAGEFTHRLITNPHGLEPFQAMSYKDKLVAVPFKKVFRKIFKKSAYTVSLGGRLTPILTNILPKDRIAVLANATNVPQGAMCKPKPGAKEPIELFFVARFARNKGIHILMQAIEELNSDGHGADFRFRLAGKGPLYEEYTQKYHYNNVAFLGFVTDEQLHESYKNADAFLFPTLFEGMPTVVLEAMTHHLPVIVSDTGATSELVDHKNGYLIEAGSVEQLKHALLQFWALSSEEKTKLSQASFERVRKQFSWSAVAEKHLHLFEMLS